MVTVRVIAASMLAVAMGAEPMCQQREVTGGNGYHLVCQPTRSSDTTSLRRGKIVVYFPGTNGNSPKMTMPFVSHSLSLGFHFFGLQYPNSPSVGDCCRDIIDAGGDQNCNLQVREMRLFGGDYDSSQGGCMHVDAQIAAVTQLREHLTSNAQNYPDGGWGEFVDSSGALNWANIIVSGESQGAGMALLMSTYFPVDRVLQFAGVADQLGSELHPARWIEAGGWQLPMDRIYGLGNARGWVCPAWQSNWEALHMEGGIVNIDGNIPSTFAGARRLCSLADTGSVGAHVAPVKWAGYDYVWTYMLTGEEQWDASAASSMGGCECVPQMEQV